MSDPILLFLAVDAIALLLLGACATALPLAACGFLATTLGGLGVLLCLPPLLMSTAATTLALPFGPPGLSLQLALDSLSAFFLLFVFVAGTAITAFQTTMHPTRSVQTTALCLAGVAFSLLAADGVALAIGLSIACAALWPPRQRHPALLIPLLVLAAVCLLAPSGFAPRFDAIRAAPVNPNHATAAAALIIITVTGLTCAGSRTRCWTSDALTAGLLVPTSAYLLLRLIAELPASAAPTWAGFVLVLAGGVTVVVQGWRGVTHPDIDGAVLCLIRRQAGLTMAGIGLSLVARAADLPGAAAFALAASFLAAIGASLAGVPTALAAHAIGESAGTHRLSRLGGLVHTMPMTSAALASGLLGLCAVPPGLGFASLWLMFQSIQSAPRTGGLLLQLPLALIGAAVALSAALTIASSLRIVGIALLGRPRTPRGAGAREAKSPSAAILLVLAGLSLLAGAIPGSTLWLLADPAIRALTGTRTGLAWVSPSAAAPGYLALPVLALLALATGAVMLVPRWLRHDVRTAGIWADGMAPPAGLPFGEPEAQSAGQGFVPPLPDLPMPRRRLPAWPSLHPPPAAAGPWLVLAAFGVLLLVLAVTL